MPADKDLFAEESGMVAMSFGEHIEELRTRLILGIMGLMVGVVVTFIPPLDLGKRVITQMERPAQASLKSFYEERARVRSAEAKKKAALTPVVEATIPAADLFRELHRLAPKLDLPTPDEMGDSTVRLPIRHGEAGMIL